jgi:glucose-1-phosphatase
MAIKVVLVDLAGVLFEFDHGHRLRVLGACLGLSPDRTDALLWESGFSADCDAGVYPDAAAVRGEIRRITGYRGADDDLDAAWCSAFRPDAAVVDLVARHSGAVEFAVFTNNGPLEEEVLPRLHPDAFRPFRHRFFCYRLGAGKPDPAVYRRVTELLGARPEQIGFADDSAGNVEGARGCGWQAVRFLALPDLAGLIP